MFRIFFIIFAISLFSCTSQNKENTGKELIKSDTITGKTEIEFDEEIHDFETLISGEIVITTFEFTNTGSHNLVIKNVESDCGCITVKFPKKPIKPGISGQIELEFDSSGMFGKQFKSIEIHANTRELKHLAIFASIKNEELEIKY